MNRVLSSLLLIRARGTIVALLVIALAVLTLAFGACANTTAVPTPTQESVTAVPTSTQESVTAIDAASATFQVVGLSINPPQGYPGQEVVIMAKVTNKGSAEGEYIGYLLINNILEERKGIVLPPGKAKTLNFSTFRDEAGIYTVTLDELKGQFEVLPEDAGTQSVSVPSCCQPSASGTTQPSCCGTSGPVTTTKPTARPSCCGG